MRDGIKINTGQAKTGPKTKEAVDGALFLTARLLARDPDCAV
jgi:hypothetical protein